MKAMHLRVIATGETELKEFLRICQTLQALGRHGCNRDFTIGIDGDGSGRMQFAVDNLDGTFLDLPELQNFNPDKIEPLSIGE